MPDRIRERCGDTTHPWRRRFAKARATIVAVILLPDVARADEIPVLRPIIDYLEAFVALDRHEFAALTLTLGVILFGVVTAIALLRTRTRTTRTLTAKQTEINDLREERDRAN